MDHHGRVDAASSLLYEGYRYPTMRRVGGIAPPAARRTVLFASTQRLYLRIAQRTRQPALLPQLDADSNRAKASVADRRRSVLVRITEPGSPR
jgi:hypothetical protein